MAAAAAAHVEERGAVAHAEAVEVDGQHGSSVPRWPRVRARRAAMRHCSTVPTAVCAPGEHLAARGRGRPRRCGPAARRRRARAGCPAASADGVARRHEEAGLVVAADDLGHGAAGGGDERHAARHRLDRGQREALVERRHARDLGLGVELDDALGGDAGDELARRPVRPSRSMSAGILLRVLRLADHHEVRVGALGAHLGQRLEQRREALHRTSALAVVMSRPGTRAMCGQRPEDLGVDADGHDVQPVGGHAHLRDDVALATTPTR